MTAGYFVNRHSSIEKARAGATELLVAGLILIAIMFAGIIFQRATIVGIASFIIGFEMISGANIFGAVFLIFGGWILIRNMRRQRAALGRRCQADAARPRRPRHDLPADPNRRSATRLPESPGQRRGGDRARRTAWTA